MCRGGIISRPGQGIQKSTSLKEKPCLPAGRDVHVPARSSQSEEVTSLKVKSVLPWQNRAKKSAVPLKGSLEVSDL